MSFPTTEELRRVGIVRRECRESALCDRCVISAMRSAVAEYSHELAAALRARAESFHGEDKSPWAELRRAASEIEAGRLP